ncbi:LpxI family protein [Roseomonas sp. CCTCC AB2023176]|uniref:LpxI family protein n=1 Tax=Roseomonas sp. CCTCC AB2023176 TaxID=3342640 RepID=UPI0035DCA98F
MPDPLAIIVGGGAVPVQVAAAARAMGRPVFALLLDGFANARDWQGTPSLTIRLGAAGQGLDWLKRTGAKDLVLAGDVKRPSLLMLRPDAGGAALIARIGMKAFGGDDSLLSAIRNLLKEEGFNPMGPKRFLSEAQVGPGLYTKAAPDALALSDIARGVEVVRSLGMLDVGQGAVIQQGLVLGVEAIEGTDALLARAGQVRREGPGGVLVKLVKPGQDRELDLPTLGPRTVAGAVAAGLRGIAFEAGGALLVDPHDMVRQADEAGLFLLSIRPEDHIPGRNPGAAA